MPLIARNYVLLSYDSFLKNHNNYLNIIGNRFDLKTKGIPPEVDKDKKSYIVNNHILDIINNNTDWDVEASLGFFRKPQER
jgi:hypothetical protein